MLESYSQAFTRYNQCEKAISQFGLLGKHPTSGGVITSSFVQMSNQFQKTVNLLWYEIYDIVKENCIEIYEHYGEDMMEKLLRQKEVFILFEKVNPMHPDKIANCIAESIVDLSYKEK